MIFNKDLFYWHLIMLVIVGYASFNQSTRVFTQREVLLSVSSSKHVALLWAQLQRLPDFVELRHECRFVELLYRARIVANIS